MENPSARSRFRGRVKGQKRKERERSPRLFQEREAIAPLVTMQLSNLAATLTKPGCGRPSYRPIVHHAAPAARLYRPCAERFTPIKLQGSTGYGEADYKSNEFRKCFNDV